MLVLASQSKTRLQMLRNAGVDCLSYPPPIDETQIQAKSASQIPAKMAATLAFSKATAVATVFPDAWVIGADQTLEFDHGVIHKSRSIAEARRVLTRLSGHSHNLHSAVSIVRNQKTVFQYISTAHLSMRSLSPAFIDNYIERLGTEALTSPGAYKIEHLGAQLFNSIEGDHFTILGLPLLPVLAFLREIGELPT